MSDCKHCGSCNIRCKQGLCYTCYTDDDVRFLYDKHDGEQLRDPRPERQPGDPKYRCLWCMAWKCDEPLRRCSDCDREHEALVTSRGADVRRSRRQVLADLD